MYDRLQLLEQGPLSLLIKEISLKDSLYPLLTEDHLSAINRRLDIVLQVIKLCAEMREWSNVLVHHASSL